MEEDKNFQNKKVKLKKEKKPLTTKQMVVRRIIFVIIFLIIVISVTAYFVISKTSGKEIVESKTLAEENENSNVEAHQGLIDLDNDTYDLNDLKITKYTGNYDELEYSYYQIDGLLDNSVEVSINYALKNDIETALKKALDEGKINKENFFASAYISSNFANTLSITYNIYSYSYEDDIYEQLCNNSIGENFDLTTGNRIKITDIFTDDTTGQMLFNSSFYSELIPSYTEQDMDEDDWYLKVTNYNDIEEEMLDLVNKFNNKRDITFSFNEQSVTILNDSASIYYEDFLDYVAIYNKYKTSNTIFDGQYSALKNLPVLVMRSNCEYQIIEEGDNYYIDISLSDVWNEDWKNEEVFESVKEYIQNEIEQIKEEASKKTNKFIIVNQYYSLSEYTIWDEDKAEWVKDDLAGYSCDYKKLTYETTKSMFKAELKDKIIEIFRNKERDLGGEEYLYDNLFLYYITDDFDSIDSTYGDFGIYSDGEIYGIENQDNEDIIWGIDD